MAESVGTAAIVTCTSSGSTTLRAARERPRVPILCVTTERDVERKAALVWGVRPVVWPDFGSLADLARTAVQIATRTGYAQQGDRAVITAGAPFGKPGTTNNLRIAHVDAATAPPLLQEA